MAAGWLGDLVWCSIIVHITAGNCFDRFRGRNEPTAWMPGHVRTSQIFMRQGRQQRFVTSSAARVGSIERAEGAEAKTEIAGNRTFKMSVFVLLLS